MPDAQVQQLNADLELFAELLAFDAKYAECAMRGRRELHTMVMGMRFQSGRYGRDRALLEADRLKRLRLEGEEAEASLHCRHFKARHEDNCE
jgi:hypothetical protein